jgi:hypothetical protein
MWWRNQLTRIDYSFVNTVVAADFRMVHTLPSVRGHISDHLGAPLAGATVYLTSVDGSVGRNATTNAAGDYSIPELAPGSYRAVVAHPAYPNQRIPGDQEQIFEAGDGGSLVIDDQFLPYGRVQLALLDSVTGRPIPGLCADVFDDSRRFERNVCTDAAGVAVADNLGKGSYTIDVRDRVGQNAAMFAQATVQAGKTTYSTLSPTIGAKIHVKVVANDDPSATPNACIFAVPVDVGNPAAQSFGRYVSACSGTTGEITLVLNRSMKVRLFAYTPSGSVYGAQWVGAAGGTGDQRAAQIVAAFANTVAEGPVIRLDRGGEIFGSVDAPSADGVCISPMAVPYGMPNGSTFAACAFAVSEGAPRFRLKGLGPYSWPLVVTSTSGWPQFWSGGAASRSQATLVSVTSGGTAIIGMEFPAGNGGQIQATLLNGPGNGTVAAYDAYTGDYLGAGSISGNTVTIKGLNSRPVILQYIPLAGAPCWPRLPAQGSLRARQTLPVTKGAVTTVTLDLVNGCSSWGRLAGPARQPTVRMPR